MSVLLPPLGRLIILQDFKSTLDQCSIRLYKNDIELEEWVSAYELVEADYEGYTPQTVTWFDPYINGNGTAIIETDSLMFRKELGGETNDIYGYYLLKDDTFEMIYAQSFNGGPLGMNREGDSIFFSARIMIGFCTPTTNRFFYFGRGSLLFSPPYERYSHEASGSLSFGGIVSPTTITGLASYAASYCYASSGSLFVTIRYFHEASGGLNITSDVDNRIRFTGLSVEMASYRYIVY